MPDLIGRSPTGRPTTVRQIRTFPRERARPAPAEGFLRTVGLGGRRRAELTELNSLSVEFEPSGLTAELVQLGAQAPSVDDVLAYEAWLDQRNDLLWDPVRTRGAVCLSHEGCAYRDWLVVSGPRRGQMWDDERAGDVDLAPAATPGGVHSFASWFRGWLSDAERIATRICE